MCNACGFGCCAFDGFSGCDCDEYYCRATRCDGCGWTVDATYGEECPCYWGDDDEPAHSNSGGAQ